MHRGAAHAAFRGDHQEKNKMISKTWKLATVLGVAGAFALSVASAEARDVRKAAHVRGAVASDGYVHQPSVRGSYNYYDAGPRNGGFIYGEPNGPSNYDRNAN
jgi:hypothetical protein